MPAAAKEVVSLGLENAVAPAALLGKAIVGRATTAVVALADGDFAVLNFDLSGRLRLAGGVSPAGNSFTPSEGLVASATLVAAVANLRFMGFAIQEAAGAVARINIRHGILDGDPLMVPVRLSANEGTSDYFGPEGILSPDGIRIHRVSGTVDIVVYHKVVA